MSPYIALAENGLRQPLQQAAASFIRVSQRTSTVTRSCPAPPRKARKTQIPAFLGHLRDRTEAAYKGHTMQARRGQALSGVETVRRRSTQLGLSFRVAPAESWACGAFVRAPQHLGADPANSCSATKAFAQNSTVQAAAR